MSEDAFSYYIHKRLIKEVFMPKVDTTNYCLVASNGADIVFVVPVPQRMSKERALNLAAYLVAMADTSMGHADFYEILAAVENT